MKVWKRVLIKVFILLLVIAAAGGGAAGWQAYRQSTPEYTIDKYLSWLIDNNSEKAYALMDQTEDGAITMEEYESALTAKKYSLYAKYQAEEMETRRDNDGNEYVDYHVEFQNADGEIQLEDDFTVKKQSEAVFGIFDYWKVLSGHCMVKNFQLTVPTGSEVYMDNEAADAGWIVRDGVSLSYDCYQIPSLIPGKISLVVRHPILESVNATLDVLGGNVDYSGKMALKEAARDECKEIGVKALKQLYSAAAKGKTDDLDELFEACENEAKSFVKDQEGEFDKENATFKNAAVSDFAVQFGDLNFTEEETGAIKTEMEFSYHYVVREETTVDTEEYDEEGNPIQQTKTQSHTGDNTAKFEMAFYDGEWHISALEVPVIPKSN